MASIVNSLLGRPDYSTPAAVRGRIIPTLSWRGNTELRKFSEQDTELYFAVRDPILSYAVQSGLMDRNELDRVTHFRIDVTNEEARFTCPDGREQIIDLHSLKDPRLIEKVQEYFDVSHQYFKTPLFQPGVRTKKGLASSTQKPLDRSHSKALTGLSTDFTHAATTLLPRSLAQLQGIPPGAEAAATQRKEVVRRHAFAQFFLLKFKDKIQEKIHTKSAELTASEARGLATREISIKLRAELTYLETLQQRLDEVDVYALTMALSAYPSGLPLGMSGPGFRPFDQMQQQAEAWLRKTVEADILAKEKEDEGTWTRIKQGINPWAAKTELSSQGKEYATDVVGMTHLSRGAYTQYCRAQAPISPKKQMIQKKEGVSDIFLREAIKFGKTTHADRSGDKAYKGVGLKESALVDGCPDTLKAEMDTMIEEVAKMASYAISEADAATFTDPKNLAQNVTDYFGKQEGPPDRIPLAPKPAIIKKVNWNMTAADLPLTPTTVVQRAGAAAGAIAGIYPLVSWIPRIGPWVTENTASLFSAAAGFLPAPVAAPVAGFLGTVLRNPTAASVVVTKASTIMSHMRQHPGRDIGLPLLAVAGAAITDHVAETTFLSSAAQVALLNPLGLLTIILLANQFFVAGEEERQELGRDVAANPALRTRPAPKKWLSKRNLALLAIGIAAVCSFNQEIIPGAPMIAGATEGALVFGATASNLVWEYSSAILFGKMIIGGVRAMSARLKAPDTYEEMPGPVKRGIAVVEQIEITTGRAYAATPEPVKRVITVGDQLISARAFADMAGIFGNKETLISGATALRGLGGKAKTLGENTLSYLTAEAARLLPAFLPRFPATFS